MIAIRTNWRELLADTRGATALEYGLICALIVVAIVGALSMLGGGSAGMWGQLDTKVSSALNS